MSLELPSASLSIRNGGLGVVQVGPTSLHVSIGPSSKGPLKTPRSCTLFSDAADIFGCGPMPKAAAYAVRKPRAPYLAIRIPAVAVAASISDPIVPAAQTVSITGTPAWAYDVVVVFTTGGSVGTPGIFYKYSIDGGVTYTTPAALGSFAVITLSVGLDVNLTPADVYASDDQIEFTTSPGSQAVKAAVITRAQSPASTSGIVIDGTPEDEYEILWEVVAGGTVGTVGITYRYSLDNGNKWQGPYQLGVALEVTLNDGAEDSGVTVTLDDGETLHAGDLATSKTTGPAWQASDVQDAINALVESKKEWRFIHCPSDSTASTLGDVASVADDLEGNSIYTYVVGAARDRTDGEIDASGQPSFRWAERLVTEYANTASDRLSVWAGRARILCPITGRKNRRPSSWIAAARLVEKTIQVDPGRKLDGPLSSDVGIFDPDTAILVEHDARVRDLLHVARFGTLRTYLRQSGVYVTRGNVMTSPGSDFNRIALRAVMDLASEIFHAMMVEQLENHLLANPLAGEQPDGPSAVPGAIAERDARVLDREFESALRNVLVARGYVSGVSARVSRTDPFLQTGELTAEVSIDPLGYVDKFTGSIGFANPAFAALTA